MEQLSPFNLIKRLEGNVTSLLTPIDILDLPAKERTAVLHLKRDLVDARLDVRDYELAETRQQQLDNAQTATKRLHQVNRYILAVSEANLFGPADVAQLSSQIEQIITNLR